MASNDQEFRDVIQDPRLIDDLKMIAKNLPQIKRAIVLLLMLIIIPVLAYDVYQVHTLNANVHNVSEAIKQLNDHAENLRAVLISEINNLKNEMATTCKTEELQMKLDKLMEKCSKNTQKNSSSGKP